jgi:hypothetical protein
MEEIKEKKIKNHKKINSEDDYRKQFQEFNYLWENDTWKYCNSSDEKFIEFNV